MSERTVVEILRAAKERITPAGNWTQRDYAKDAAGNCVSPTGVAATCWCAHGAIEAESGGSNELADGAKNFLRRACRATTFYQSGITLNDGGTHGEVLAAFDSAIAIAEARF